MNFKINSKVHGVISFFMPSDGGYLYLESVGKPGTLGRQICEGGDFMGSCLRASPESMERVCRRWHKQRLAAIEQHGGEYGNGKASIGRPPLPADQVAKPRSIRLNDSDYSELQRRGMDALREWLRDSA